MLHLYRKQYESAHIHQPVELHFHSSLEQQGLERLRLLLIKRTCKWSRQSKSALTKLAIATTGCPAWTRRRRSPFQSRATASNTSQQATGDKIRRHQLKPLLSARGITPMACRSNNQQPWGKHQYSLIQRLNQSCSCKKNSSRVCDQPVTSFVAQARRAN